MSPKENGIVLPVAKRFVGFVRRKDWICTIILFVEMRKERRDVKDCSI
jgi:hypothetical protein